MGNKETFMDIFFVGDPFMFSRFDLIFPLSTVSIRYSSYQKGNKGDDKLGHCEQFKVMMKTDC